MEQALKTYLIEMTTVLAELNAAPDPVRLRLVLERHLAQVSAFQHERLIHLLVTLFFALLLLVALGATLWLQTGLLFVLDAIVLVTLLFYIRHYFFLENNVQKLYPITEELYRLLAAR